MKPRSPKRVNNSLTSAVAWKLKQLRVAKGFSQEYVKENTGVNIQRSESSTTTVSLITLDILCKFYGTSLKEFFNSTNKSSPCFFRSRASFRANGGERGNPKNAL